MKLIFTEVSKNTIQIKINILILSERIAFQNQSTTIPICIELYFVIKCHKEKFQIKKTGEDLSIKRNSRYIQKVCRACR
jgi:hypothetical protein